MQRIDPAQPWIPAGAPFRYACTMFQASILTLFACGTCLAQAAEPVWRAAFDASTEAWPREVIAQVPGRGGVVHISVVPGSANPGRTIAVPVPVDRVRGKRVFLGADVKIASVSRKPNSWNGVKVMLIIESPSGKTYPQPEIPDGDREWQRYSTRAFIPETASGLTLVLGLEQVTGEAWFDNVTVIPSSGFRTTLKVDPASPVFLGHSAPRLRGAMAGTALGEDDVKHFATVWKGNLLRLQIFEAARSDRDLNDYDPWLQDRLEHMDRLLAWCEKYGVTAVVDLHSPPGGQAFSAGYVTARGRLFTQPAAQAKFVQVWEKLAARYKGWPSIWGFDLVNEPDDSMLAEGCLDWNSLADKTARAIRAIDPDRTLIIQPAQWGGPQGFEFFEPLDLPRIIYSFHFYQPMRFTHQGILQHPPGVSYPGWIGSERWDSDALERAMRPAVDFARKYRVQMYVGEFSAIRTAPGDSAAKYLADVTAILEKHGFDWSYHAYREWQGWSLEHEGPLDKPLRTQIPTDRQKIVTGWFSKNGEQ